MKYALVAVGYNRPHSMERLLRSLERAYYGGDSIELYVSIDNSGTDAVEKFAEGFQWSHGEKHILTYPQRQGLRNHIMGLGRLLDEYDAIAMFEDDVVVAEGFYHYMKQAIEFYSEEDRVAGISLYTNLWNEFACLPFRPMSSEYDAYFFQFAESRGQIWLKKQWREFKKWYDEHNGESIASENMPEIAANWPKSSWKKYHIKYCIETNKFFVYPYQSQTTIFSDIGTHTRRIDTFIQVELSHGIKKLFKFPSIDSKSAVFYDAFYERMLMPQNDGFEKYKNCCFDLYGMKQGYEGKRFVLSTKNLPYKIIESYGFQMKPQEENIFWEVEGNSAYMYDTQIPEHNTLKNAVGTFRYRYDLYDHSRELMACVKESLCQRVKNLFRK